MCVGSVCVCLFVLEGEMGFRKRGRGEEPRHATGVYVEIRDSFRRRFLTSTLIKQVFLVSVAVLYVPG